ncbi:MAG: hypothetical protein ACRDMU_09085 [Gaiellaceae bacterium]
MVLVIVIAGCGSGEDTGQNAGGSGGASVEAASRVERCVERFLERAASDGLAETDVRRYIEATYCSRFEREGWIDDDGTLSIAAHLAFEEGGSEECVTAEAGEEAETVSCEELEGSDGPLLLDCAILHLVRRSEVQEYLEELEQRREVSCDDGTPLDRLGRP